LTFTRTTSLLIAKGLAEYRFAVSYKFTLLPFLQK